MKQFYLLSLLLLLVGGCASPEPTPITHQVKSSCSYYALTSAECIDKEAYIKSIEPYKVIFIGDHHHSAAAHQLMLETINGLADDGYRVLVANEWFSPKENGLLSEYIAGDLDINGSKALGWKKRVGYDFNLSEPIFEAVIKEEGALYGINMDKKFKKMVSEQNVSAMSDEQRSFYERLDLNVSAHRALLEPFLDTVIVHVREKVLKSVVSVCIEFK